MWRVVTCAVALMLWSCRHGAQPTRSEGGQATQAGPRQDDPKLFYSLGTLAADNLLSTYGLTPEEVPFVEAGLEAWRSGTAPTLGEDDPRVEEARGKLWRRAELKANAHIQAQNSAFLEEASQQEGVERLESGAIFSSLEEGSGPAPGDTGKVEAHVRSTLADGTLLSDSREQGESHWIDLERMQEPRCLREGLLRLKEGGRARLVCPPDERLNDWMGIQASTALVVVLEVDLVAVEPPPAEEPEPPPVYRRVEIAADEPSFGPKDAKVTVVVWLGSRGVPAELEGTLKRLREQYPRELRLVPRFHFKPGQVWWRRVAEAVLAAHAQGRSWDYYERFLSNKSSEDYALQDNARALKLDMARFMEAMDFRLFRARAEAQAAAGRALGLEEEGITFFVNGREIREPSREDSWAASKLPPGEVLDQIIEQEKARAERLLAAGTPRRQLYARLIEGGLKPAPLPAPTETGLERLELRHSPARGPASAPVTLVFFADFLDGTSVAKIPKLRWLEREYAGKIRLVFKHRPSPERPQARRAALAALAAHEQGKFWEYHDRLFAHRNALDDEALIRYARELGLDERRFQEALDSRGVERWLETDIREAQWLEFQFTPAIYLNRRVVHFGHIHGLRQLIDEELARKSK